MDEGCYSDSIPLDQDDELEDYDSELEDYNSELEDYNSELEDNGEENEENEEEEEEEDRPPVRRHSGKGKQPERIWFQTWSPTTSLAETSIASDSSGRKRRIVVPSGRKSKKANTLRSPPPTLMNIASKAAPNSLNEAIVWITQMRLESETFLGLKKMELKEKMRKERAQVNLTKAKLRFMTQCVVMGLKEEDILELLAASEASL
ncbi:hypothetical protein BGZ54_003351 [Gamsiella multidivaricata]|nr:hypothetical protein BGZ54_003351 [Gamsiella multidivaricata]